MKHLKKYKFFILISVIFLGLIFTILLTDDQDQEKIAFDTKNHIEPSKKDKSSALQDAFETDRMQQENKNKFLTSAEKMIGIIDFEDDFNTPKIQEQQIIFEKNLEIEEVKPIVKTEKKSNSVKKVKNPENNKTEKKEEPVVNPDDYWVSVGEARTQRGRKSSKIGYKTAHIETLGEKIKDGDKISLVLDEAIQLGDQLIPEETELFGTISFSKKRGIIKVTRILYEGNALTCNIDAYDMDGYLGIALDIDVEQEIMSDVVDEGINQATTYGGQASKLAASMVSSAAKKVKTEPYIKIENKRKVYLSVN